MNKSLIDELFGRGVAQFVDPEGIFRKKIEEKINGTYKGEIIIKLGVDPTRPDIHLGHAVALRKLRAFQDIGCKVVFLIGDYTTQIGDPTGKSKTRPEITQLEIEANMKTYLDQIGKILKLEPDVFSWIRNSDWYLSVTDIVGEQGAKVSIPGIDGAQVETNSFLGKAITFGETRMQKTHLKNPIIHNVSLSRVLGTLRHITHARLIERDMFQERLNSGSELYMHEMLYPVLQGIDSSVLANIYGSCDLEVGGTDQTFNMLMGRDVMKMNKQQEQAVMSVDILEGLDGKEKMSKSLDNYISIADDSKNMYGKVMSLPDSLISRYFLLCTYTNKEDVIEIEKNLSAGTLHPKETKMRLAREITAIYHGDKEAGEAEESFVSTFSKGEIPEDVLEVDHNDGKVLIDVLVENGLVSSKSEARRLFEQGAITHLENDQKIEDQKATASKGTYRIGKHRFLKLK